MRADNLDHKELLELDPEGGVIRFAGQRALLLDAVAMGLLRKYLVENFGLTAARTVLTQFGFAHGWRMAEAMQAEFKWDSDDDWRRAGTRIHALEGLFRVEPGSKGAAVQGGRDAARLLRGRAAPAALRPRRRAGVLDHLRPHQRLPQPQRRQGDLRPRRPLPGQGRRGLPPVGRTREEWGDERAEELRFFEAEPPQGMPRRLAPAGDRDAEGGGAQAARRTAARWCAWRASVDEPLGIVAKSAAMRQVVDLARRVAKVDSTVLITGESGSGKERIARLVHDESTRAAGPFIAVNCGAITETLLESELFGHARGAFTGATAGPAGAVRGGERRHAAPRRGRRGLAWHAGQAAARAAGARDPARRREQEPARSTCASSPRPTATSPTAVAGGTFRQDLYYRLKVVELHVPPLRERRDDILPLARVLLADAALRMKRKIAGLAPGAADQLLRYDWPGNVRELENAMERAVALARGSRVELEDLPEEIRQAFPMPVATPRARCGRSTRSRRSTSSRRWS